MVGWAQSGGAQGDPKDAPAPIEWSDGWSIGEPDVILEMPIEFNVPATGTIPYQYIVFPTGFTEDKWVERIEVRPGNRAVVHHMIASVAPHNPATPQGRFFDLESSPNRPGADKTTQFAAGGAGETLHVFVPGGNAPALEPGQARLIKAGSDILMQLHYTTIGTEASDQTRIGFVFAKKPPVERVRGVLIYNTDFTIPAGSANAMVMAAAEVKSDLKLVSLLPHMHLRGKSFSYRATYPDGTQEVLLDVPKYDFNWQINYYLAEPKLLPKGTAPRVRRSLRQLDRQSLEPRSDHRRPLRRPDLGRDAERLHGSGHRPRAASGDLRPRSEARRADSDFGGDARGDDHQGKGRLVARHRRSAGAADRGHVPQGRGAHPPEELSGLPSAWRGRTDVAPRLQRSAPVGEGDPRRRRAEADAAVGRRSALRRVLQRSFSVTAADRHRGGVGRKRRDRGRSRRRARAARVRRRVGASASPTRSFNRRSRSKCRRRERSSTST